MHLLEKYALDTGSKIGEPHILTKYFPLPFDKYITIHLSSKGSKTYDHGQEVINILLPYLQANGINIVQLGAKEDPHVLQHAYRINGQTNAGQTAYVVKNSMLHIGVDSFPLHLAGYFNVPLIGLYSHTHINTCSPYWGDKDKQILIEPHRPECFKPSFSNEEHPKTINQISPEKIAKNACKLLGFNYQYEYLSVLTGEQYSNQYIEMSPDKCVDPRQYNCRNIIVRMDFHFDEPILIQQLNISKCFIITDRPLTPVINNFKHNIEMIYYVLEQQNDPNFVKFLIKNNIPHTLLTFETGEILNKIKLDYLDLGIIVEKRYERPSVLDKYDKNKLYYRSNKLILSKGQIFPSHHACKNNQPVGGFFHEPLPLPQDNNFWRDIDYINVLIKQ